MAKLDTGDIFNRVLNERKKYSNSQTDRFGKLQHIPFLIGRDSDLPEQYIHFWVNPSQCGWRVGLRATIEKVAGGAIHHEWPTLGIGTQESDTLMDNPVISFSFQSGAIFPGAHEEMKKDGSQIPTSSEAPIGLGNFYDFIEVMTQSNVKGNGEPNYVNILYTSNVFPNIWLQGFFTEEGVNWDDSADNPNMVGNWGANFMVFKSYPNLSNAYELHSQFKAWGFQAFGR